MPGRWDDDEDDDYDEEPEDEPEVRCPNCRGWMLETAPRCPACGHYPSLEESRESPFPAWVRVTAAMIAISMIGLLLLGL